MDSAFARLIVAVGHVAAGSLNDRNQVVISTGRRNTLVKSLRWSFEV